MARYNIYMSEWASICRNLSFKTATKSACQPASGAETFTQQTPELDLKLELE